MEYLTENPLFPALFGGFLTIAFGVMYAQSKDTRVVPFLALALLATITPIVIDGLVVTDREELRSTIGRLASAVASNDVATAASYTHPDYPIVRQRIEREMPTYDFSICTVVGYRKVQIHESDPDKATVAFTVFVNVAAPRYGHEGTATRIVELEMVRHGDDWKIANYKHYGSGGAGVRR